MRYFATFKENGERITTYVEGLHKIIPEDAIEISEEDQHLYATNEYIRGEDGNPVKKINIISDDEIKERNLMFLRHIREEKFKELQTRIDRFNNQKAIKVKTADSKSTIIKILNYMEVLRNLPETINLLETPTLPEEDF